MRHIFNKICKSVKCGDPSLLDYSVAHLVGCKDRKLLGIVLNDSFLFVHIRDFYSFRLYPHNIGMVEPFSLSRSQQNIDKDYLEDYFRANMDNPYGVMNVIHCIVWDKPVRDLTQFPPLFQKKDPKSQVERLNHMRSIARCGDAVFSFDRSSPAHHIIRKYDYSHWAHVGTVDKGKTIVEVTTSGWARSDFMDLSNPSYDVALYRPRGIVLTPEQEDRMQAYFEHWLKRKGRFDWFELIPTYLHKRWNIPIKHKLTPSEMMNANTAELIAYV